LYWDVCVGASKKAAYLGKRSEFTIVTLKMDAAGSSNVCICQPKYTALHSRTTAFLMDTTVTTSNVRGQRKDKLYYFNGCENTAPVLRRRKIYEVQAFQSKVLKTELGHKIHYVRLSEQWSYSVGRAVYKDAAALEPEPPQHSKPTFVWAYVVHRQTCVATFNPTCLCRLILSQGFLVLSLLIVGDVRVG
jgi:hypothetical protein